METPHIPQFKIDRDGQWFTDGMLMIRKEIIRLFAENMQRDDAGRYAIRWQGHSYPVEVEDVPFNVRAVAERQGQLELELLDGRTLPMPPGPLLLRDGVPYLSLSHEWDTKLSRQAFSELGKYLTEREGAYFIQYGAGRWPVLEA